MENNNIMELLSKFSQSLQLASKHWVWITHVNNPHSFYVRPVKFDDILNKLESETPTVKLEEPLMHQLIVYKSCDTKIRYIRGQIYKINDKQDETTFDIFAIDYGYIQKSVTLEMIWNCINNIQHVPPLAYHCELANCAPLGGEEWSENAIDALKYYLGDERCEMVIVGKAPNKLIVEMINSCPDDIATLLALTGYTTLGYRHNMINRMYTGSPRKMFYNFRNLNLNETLHVRMLYGSSLDEFYVAEINDYKEHLNNKQMITSFSKKGKELTNAELVENFPVGVLDELRNCERAIIKAVAPSKCEATVQLVDIGKIVKAHAINMRHMPEVCLNNTVTAIYCCVTQNQPLETGLHRIFHPGYEFSITIRKLGHQFKSPNIVSISALQ